MKLPSSDYKQQLTIQHEEVSTEGELFVYFLFVYYQLTYVRTTKLSEMQKEDMTTQQ